jgi:hypothetical protein
MATASGDQLADGAAVHMPTEFVAVVPAPPGSWCAIPVLLAALTNTSIRDPQASRMLLFVRRRLPCSSEHEHQGAMYGRQAGGGALRTA